MRRAPAPLVFSGLLALACVGASCERRGAAEPESPPQPNAAPRATSAPSASSRIEELPGVDASSLTSAERETWVALANDVLSPCGEPVSVARCVAEARRCSSCVPAARNLVRWVAEGYERAEIETMFTARFGAESRFEVATDGAPVRGAPMAPVTVVEFSDFECPHCAAAHPVLRRLIAEFDGRVRVVFKHYPLDGHENALPAARAAVAAQNQGKFWELHDLLFEHQRDLNPARIEALAAQVGLDMARFRTDFASPEVQARVEADKAEGRRVGVDGTPAFFINGRRFMEGASSLSAYVREELDR